MNRQDFQELFVSSLQSSPLKHLSLEEDAMVSYYMDIYPIQDSFRYRAKQLALKIAGMLIDENGELKKKTLESLRSVLVQGPYLLGPGMEADALIFKHVSDSLQLLERDPRVWALIKKFSHPLVHKAAEQIIRETLWPESVKVVENSHIRRAVLAAWLTFLRQTTGSCFATAPAILIQRNQPQRLIEDLYDLLSTGRMKRIIAGKEYAVPLSLNLGKTDLQKPIEGSVQALSFSPGLIAALESVGLIESKGSMNLKIGRLKNLLSNREEIQSIEKLIRILLLEHADLTEEDLESEEYLSRIQMTPLLAKQTAIYYQKPSERAVRVSDWKKRFAAACSAFQAFSECALLRSWEYTLASFCDVKLDFARWNLYVGLGFDSNQNRGLGQFLYKEVDRHLQKANEEANRLHQEYEQAIGAARGIEAAIRGASSEAYRNQLKGELTSYIHAANSTLELRDEAAAKAEALSGFFSSLIRQFDQKFQDYFQELFDPSLLGKEAHLYEDSPAGFRLFYKHGRGDPSQWTSIRSGEEYIRSLREFFSAVENDIEIPPTLEREFLSLLMTALIQFIQEPEFLQSAIDRSKEKGKESPWEYVSGGTMETLLQSYWGRDRPLTEVSLIAHSEEQVLSFILKEGQKDPLLIHSPTHAFILHTGLLPKKWDHLVAQNRDWNKKWKLNEEVQEHLAHRLSEKLPNEERALFLHLYRQKNHVETTAQFRSQLIDCLSQRVKNRAAFVDSILYEEIPVVTHDEAKKILQKIVGNVKLEGSLIGSNQLFQIAKGALLQQTKNPFSTKDLDKAIIDALRSSGYCYPHPLLFADSNWSGWFFGFIVNAATGQLELWRLNRIGNQGYPMTEWKEWMAPNNKAPWILLPRPEEYST